MIRRFAGSSLWGAVSGAFGGASAGAKSGSVPESVLSGTWREDLAPADRPIRSGPGHRAPSDILQE